jgi:hypothetical protein
MKALVAALAIIASCACASAGEAQQTYTLTLTQAQMDLIWRLANYPGAHCDMNAPQFCRDTIDATAMFDDWNKQIVKAKKNEPASHRD